MGAVFVSISARKSSNKSTHASFGNKKYISQVYLISVRFIAKNDIRSKISLSDDVDGSAVAPKYQCDKCLKTFATVGHGLMIAINAMKTLNRKRRVIIAIKITLVKNISTNMLKSVPSKVNG